jgi:ornithine carbamoyltransferase
MLALIFQPPSSIPGIPFEVGVIQMGGNPISVGSVSIQEDILKSPEIYIKTLERWVDGIVIKIPSQKVVTELAHFSHIPVFNIQTDLLQPCQAIADFFIFKEFRKELSGMKLAFIGRSNNLCHSLIYAAAKVGARISVAAPQGYEPQGEVIKLAKSDGAATGFELQLTSDPFEAIRDATVIYTSPGASSFSPQGQILHDIKAKTMADVQFMNYLPEPGGIGTAGDICDLDRSVFFEQTETILHIQKAIMVLLFESKK